MARQTVAARAYEQLKSALKEGGAGRATAAGGSTGGRTGSCGLGSLGRSPVPGQQFGQARARPTLGQAIDDVGEIGVRIESVEASRFDNRVYVCRAQAAFVAAEEEEILPCDCDGPQPSFGDIVVYGEATVAGVARKRFPTAEAVLDRLAERALQRQPPAFSLEPTLELGQQRHGTRLPLGELDIGGLAVDLSLDGIERTDPAQR